MAGPGQADGVATGRQQQMIQRGAGAVHSRRPQQQRRLRQQQKIEVTDFIEQTPLHGWGKHLVYGMETLSRRTDDGSGPSALSMSDDDDGESRLD